MCFSTAAHLSRHVANTVEPVWFSLFTRKRERDRKTKKKLLGWCSFVEFGHPEPRADQSNDSSVQIPQNPRRFFLLIQPHLLNHAKNSILSLHQSSEQTHVRKSQLLEWLGDQNGGIRSPPGVLRMHAC